MASSPLVAAVFVAAATLSLSASVVLVVRLERVGARLGLSEALLGLLAALAADTPEITSAVTALTHGEHDVSTGVVLGSNVFNLAALLGLGAVVAGRIRLHPRVVIFEGSVALWIAALSIAAAASLIAPAAALVLALTMLAPYVYVSALQPSSRAAIRCRPGCGPGSPRRSPRKNRNYPRQSIPPKAAADAGAGALALGVVLVASFAMERSVSVLGARFAVPAAITGAIVLAAVTSLPNAVAAVYLARRGRAAATLSEALNSNTLNVLAGLLLPAAIIAGPALGSALPVALWYGTLTAATLALALAGRGITRHSGFLIIAAYAAFVITVVATAH